MDTNGDGLISAPGTDSEEENIVVTREEEEIDPEDEADFEREYAKMMAESLDSRKFERKPTFDVPLPMRRRDRETTSIDPVTDENPVLAAPISAQTNTMAFSLLTKRGNRQQVCGPVNAFFYHCLYLPLQTRTVELPSDSNFAVAMKTQQAAEREEQQRIKNLVLNYDLREAEDQDGDSSMLPITPNSNIHSHSAGIERLSTPTGRPDKSGTNRSGQRARKLQLSDVDWYGRFHQGRR